jgi:beta-lactamase regulating signal transducer with metallopeptidase domain
MGDAAAGGVLLQALGWALVHSLWQCAVLGLALRMALRLGRSAPSTHRYALACAALVLMLAAGVATTAGALRRAEPVAGAGPRIAADRPPPVRARGAEAAAGAAPAALADVAPRRLPADGVRAALAWTREAVDRHLAWLVAAWLAGVAALSLRLGATWLYVRRLTRVGVGAPPRAVRDAVARLADALGIRRPVAALASTRVHVPAVVGWIRPVVLLPVSALTGLTPLQLELLVLHELAHVRRHDYLVNLLQAVCETLLFYHPAVWYVGRQIRAEREHCCDDLAAGLAGTREYVAALATMEEIRRAPALLAVAADGGSLLERVLRLAGPPRHASPPRLGAALLVLGLAGALAAQAAGAPPGAEPAAAAQAPAAVACVVPGPAEGSTVCPALEREVGALLARYPRGSAAVVQEVTSGAVLAYSAVGDGAGGLTEPVLPGSVWKLVLATLWWERGLGDGPLECPARLDVGGRTVAAAAGMPPVLAGPHDMLVHSCSTAAAAMALRLRDAAGADAVLAGVRRLGFGVARDGARPDGRDTTFWATRSPAFRARMSPAPVRVALAEGGGRGAWAGFATGAADVRVAPLHVARFVQAIGNDGVGVAPTVDGALARAPGGTRLFARETAWRLQGAMLDAVRRGTARAAGEEMAGSPWQLGGKTGTVAADGADDDGWFAGLAFDRAERARYVVVVRIPGGGPGGGEPARLAARIARLLPPPDAPVAVRPALARLDEARLRALAHQDARHARGRSSGAPE